MIDSDFDEQKLYQKAKKSSTIGTVAQMAPEFIKDKTTSKLTDVYAFGIVLWEIMTWQIAYYDKEEVQIMYGVAH